MVTSQNLLTQPRRRSTWSSCFLDNSRQLVPTFVYLSIENIKILEYYFTDLRSALNQPLLLEEESQDVITSVKERNQT